MLAKGESKRLPNKNKLDFDGQPMFVWNLKKMIRLYEDVYLSSDDKEILSIGKKMRVHIIKRPKELCGDTPNIPCYQHALKFMKNPKAIVAVQANSPTVRESKIFVVNLLMGIHDEVMTKHPDGSMYGSIWGISFDKLKKYRDFYNPKPDFLVEDLSVDVHTKSDFNKALEQL